MGRVAASRGLPPGRTSSCRPERPETIHRRYFAPAATATADRFNGPALEPVHLL